jgi:hypothetical protein
MQQVGIALDKLLVSALNARKDLQAGQEDSGIDELASSIRQQRFPVSPNGYKRKS